VKKVLGPHGWLHSPDGKKSAWVLFKAGKNQDGYFTNEDIVKQAEAAMDIVSKHYPNEDHGFVFDNATTHLKRNDTVLTAQKMTKGPSKTFGVKVTVVDESGKVSTLQIGNLKRRPSKWAQGGFLMELHSHFMTRTVSSRV
jgi:hypothetical protein